MKTQYFAASSLDGFIADADHSLDWLFQFGEGPGGSFQSFIDTVGAIAMGSSSYEWMLRYFARSSEPSPWPYQQPVWVFSSRQLPAVDGARLHFVSGDVRPVHESMAAAAGGKNIWIVGGGDLAGQFYDHGLLDELIVQIASVTLRQGAPLFPRAIKTPPLRLISATTFGSAYAELRYEVPKPIASQQ